MPPKSVAMPAENAKASGEKHSRDNEDYDEIYEDVQTVRSVLVRFPCFDFFRDVGLCEEEEEENHVVDGAPSCVAFRPDTVSVDKRSLTTEHPTLVLNKGTEKEMHFRGFWSEVDTLQHVTNRVVLHVDKKENDEDDTLDATKGSDMQATPNSTTTTTASLFAHAEVGITSDEARLMRERKTEWYYDHVEVPCATLVMERSLF